MKDYIIGAGATAFVLSKLFPEAKVVAPKTGPLPETFYLWDEPHVIRFLQDSNIKSSRERVRIGSIPSNVTDSQIKLYNQITFKSEDSLPSKKRRGFDALSCKFEQVKIDIKGKVVNVNFGARTFMLDNGKEYEYQSLLWTAPHSDLFYAPILYIEVEASKRAFGENYVYLFDYNFLSRGVYRVTRKDKGRYVIEAAAKTVNIDMASINSIIADVSECFVTNFKYVRHFYQRIGHSVINVRLPDLDRYCVYFFGRFAQLNHEIMISNVIEKAYNLLEDRKQWR